MLRDKFYQDMIQARKSGDKELLSALILLWNEITSTEKSEKLDKVPDEKFLALVRKMIKQDNDTLEAFKQRGDQDPIKALEVRIKVYESYLPVQLSDEALTEIIYKVATGRTKKEMGLVIKEVKTLVAGKADMSKVSSLVKSILES